jgi:acyl transferase domain-containing protein
MRSAYRRANVALNSVDYVECHATGTQKGDVVEATALGRVFGGCEV